MQQPKLSICIPTFNRSQFLIQLLNNLKGQITEDLLSYVEICISNNASEDNTKEVVECFMKEHSNLSVVYSENEENIFEENFIKAVEISNAEFCWLIGDDDLPEEGAVARVLQELTTDLDILLFDVKHFDFNMEEHLGTVKCFKHIDKSRVFDFSIQSDMLEYFEKATAKNMLFTFISNTVFKRASWIKAGKIQKAKEFLGKCSNHVFLNLDTLVNEKGRIKYINDSLVWYRSGNNPKDYSEKLLYHHYCYLQLSGINYTIEGTVQDEELRKAIKNILKKDLSIFFFCGCQLREDESTFIYSFYDQEDVGIYKHVNYGVEEIQNNREPVILFGASNFGKTVLELLQEKGVFVECFSDNSEGKWATDFCGKPVVAPIDLIKFGQPLIIITSMYVKQIYRQLSGMGFQNIKHISNWDQQCII